MPSERDDAELLASIAANVRRGRARRGWSQEELAERADLTVRQLQRIERGTLNFGVVTLVAIAAALESSATALLRPAKLAPATRGRPRKSPK